MADGELGNLRRAPRIIEHKISKQSRYRTEGMAGGQFDAVIPVDVTDTISSLSDSSSDGGGPVPDWFTESLTLTSGAAATWTLTYIPLDFSEVISLNGIVLVEAVDYTIADNVVTWTNLADLIRGIGSDSWKLTATYPYYDQAAEPDPSIVGVYVDNGQTTGNRTLFVPAAPVATNLALLVTSNYGVSVSGVFATWTQVFGEGLDDGISIWMGSGVGTGTTVTIADAFPADNNTVMAIYDNIASVALVTSATNTYSPFTGTMSTSLASPTSGHLLVGAARARGSFWTTGVHSESGFGSAPQSGDSHEANGQGVGATFGLSDGTAATSSFGVQQNGGGNGSATTVEFSWTPA